METEAIEPFAGRISRGEWLQVLGWSAVILLVTSLPYLFGALISSPEAQFGGLVIGVEDGNSYLAKMRLGATGAWQFNLFYTTEPHQGAYLFLFHLLLGKIARLSGLSFVVTYHLARFACGLFLLASVYRFVAFFTNLRPVRWLTLWMVGIGGGLGWLVALLGLMDQLGLPLDFYSPEAFIFHALFALPHLSLAEGLLLWAIVLILIAWESHQQKYALLGGLAFLGMAIVAAFYIVIAAVVVGMAWLLRRWQLRGEDPGPWAEAGLAVLAFGISAPVPLYNAYVFTTNPVFQIWAEQNRILSPSPVHYLLAFGPLVLLAVVGIWTEWRLGLMRNIWSRRSMLLLGWCLAVPLLVYVPFNLQRRLTLGVQVPLSILAALGLWRLFVGDRKDDVLEEQRRPVTKDTLRRWRIVSASLVALMSLSNLMILFGAGLEVSRRSPPIFHSLMEIDAADWLGAHATDDQVVLAAYETSNYLPTRMSARVFAGHGPETIHSDAKRDMQRQFFAGRDDVFHRELLSEYGVSYVFYGPAEQALGDFSPGDVPYLRQVYENDGVQVFEVVSASHD